MAEWNENKPVRWKLSFQAIDQQFFHFLVGFGDQIDVRWLHLNLFTLTVSLGNQLFARNKDKNYWNCVFLLMSSMTLTSPASLTNFKQTSKQLSKFSASAIVLISEFIKNTKPICGFQLDNNVLFSTGELNLKGNFRCSITEFNCRFNASALPQMKTHGTIFPFLSMALNTIRYSMEHLMWLTYELSYLVSESSRSLALLFSATAHTNTNIDRLCDTQT